MEMLPGNMVTESTVRSRRARILDAALLAAAIIPPTIVLTVYAMCLLNNHTPIGYPWQLVSAAGQSVVALAVRRVAHRLSAARLAVFAVAFVLMTTSAVMFVRASASTLAIAIERAARI